MSPSHLHDKLHLTEDEAVERAVRAVKLARNFVDDVEFYAEDAGRADQDFLCRIIEAAIKAGATVVNIPDTTGYNMPWSFGARIADLRNRVAGIEDATISVHTHNDLGMATALAIDAVAQRRDAGRVHHQRARRGARATRRSRRSSWPSACTARSSTRIPIS